ncbi:MAG: hydroxylamine oxidoreductase [Candidatus Brocadiaceae bacterium]|nr:hydroxylamine oxidoreductase [Candidatus Brocadiaceae bacterium]
MFGFFGKPLSKVVGATFAIAGATLLTCAMERGAMAEGPTFQDVASSVFGQAVGPDNDGTLYVFGLTAHYTQPEYVQGRGPYKSFLKMIPSIRWYDPEHYWTNGSQTEGEFKNEECVLCHTVQTPTIVNDWKKSSHGNKDLRRGIGIKKDGKPVEDLVGCGDCHGNNHQDLKMPTYKLCNDCHPKETSEHRAGGLGSHTHAYTVNVLEFSWHVGKPAEEVAGCAYCHAIAENRCSGCHTRHIFDPGEARKPTACRVCHMGIDHDEWAMYNTSIHGALYEAESSTMDWSKKIKKGNYRVPACAYCHMQNGDHNPQRFGTIYSDMGMFQVDRGAPKHKAKRDAWIKLCQDCHSPRFAKDKLEEMDAGINLSFTKWREAAAVIVGCFLDGVVDPMPEGSPPDWYGHYTFSLLPGGDPRFYATSNLERLGLEMICYLTGNVYKAYAHMSMYNQTYGNGSAFEQDRKLVEIKTEAAKLRRFAAIEKKIGLEHKSEAFWQHGEYLDLLPGWIRKPGDVDQEWVKRTDIPHRANADFDIKPHH